MKHPVWILNSSLLVLVILASGFIVFSRQKPKARESIEPSGFNQPLKSEGVKVEIDKIYENDLFGTYHKELPSFEAGVIMPRPEPPMPRSVSVPAIPTPQFLDPLGITLKGIIVMINDDNQNRVIIADNKTNKESTYRIGQSIEDAQLIKILSNKVIFLRSNGQQEVLYLREKDAKMDPAYIMIGHWEEVVQKVSSTEFTVSPREFLQRVTNLAQFIDMLDLVTVYKSGKSIGCRIGNKGHQSLAAALGLRDGDIILAINTIPATNTEERFRIYKTIVAMHENDTITVDMLRNNQPITMVYTLKDFKQKPIKPTSGGATTTVEQQPTSDQLREEQLKSLQQRHKFAPTVDEIRARERATMMRNGKSTSVTNINAKTVE